MCHRHMYRGRQLVFMSFPLVYNRPEVGLSVPYIGYTQIGFLALTIKRLYIDRKYYVCAKQCRNTVKSPEDFHHIPSQPNQTKSGNPIKRLPLPIYHEKIVY